MVKQKVETKTKATVRLYAGSEADLCEHIHGNSAQHQNVFHDTKDLMPVGYDDKLSIASGARALVLCDTCAERVRNQTVWFVQATKAGK